LENSPTACQNYDLSPVVTYLEPMGSSTSHPRRSLLGVERRVFAQRKATRLSRGSGTTSTRHNWCQRRSQTNRTSNAANGRSRFTGRLNQHPEPALGAPRTKRLGHAAQRGRRFWWLDDVTEFVRPIGPRGLAASWIVGRRVTAATCAASSPPECGRRIIWLAPLRNDRRRSACSIHSESWRSLHIGQRIETVRSPRRPAHFRSATTSPSRAADNVGISRSCRT